MILLSSKYHSSSSCHLVNHVSESQQPCHPTNDCLISAQALFTRHPLPMYPTHGWHHSLGCLIREERWFYTLGTSSERSGVSDHVLDCFKNKQKRREPSIVKEEYISVWSCGAIPSLFPHILESHPYCCACEQSSDQLSIWYFRLGRFLDWHPIEETSCQLQILFCASPTGSIILLIDVSYCRSFGSCHFPR